MERRKILVIGMLDSIHLSRWLKQFENEPADFFLMPSKKFKRLHPELSKLLKSGHLAKYILPGPYIIMRLSGYIDFTIEKLGQFLKLNLRLKILLNIITKKKFDYVHAIELQGAGYLYSKLPERIQLKNILILTNWGSDIYFFQRSRTHSLQIEKVIRAAAFYSAECERDYDLLANYSFTGKFLPCIPNGGGFTKEEMDFQGSPPSKRNLILCKGYGGTFGQAQTLILPVCEILRQNISLRAFFFSVTKDTEKLLLDFTREFGPRLKFSTVKQPLPRPELMELFSEARVYLGCSKSDGISTAFLEAIVHGSYPIQTNTSCANEWVKKGISASIVNAEQFEIYNSLNLAVTNDALVDFAYNNNSRIAKELLDYDKIKNIAKTFYSL